MPAHKEKRVDSFHYEEQVSPVQRDESPYMPQWFFIHHTLYTELSPLSAQFLFWGVTTTERSTPMVVLTAYDGGAIYLESSNPDAFNKNAQDRSAYKTRFPPKQSVTELQGKRCGIELVFDFSCSRCLFV